MYHRRLSRLRRRCRFLVLGLLDIFCLESYRPYLSSRSTSSLRRRSINHRRRRRQSLNRSRSRARHRSRRSSTSTRVLPLQMLPSSKEPGHFFWKMTISRLQLKNRRQFLHRDQVFAEGFDGWRARLFAETAGIFDVGGFGGGFGVVD